MQTASMNRGTTPGERLKLLRKERFRSAAEAARALGLPEPTYSAHENESRGIPREAAVRYARFFKASLDWLLTGKGSVRGRTTVPVVGYVGAGAEIIPVDDFAQGDGLELVEPPLGVDFPCVAARVKGNSMYPFEEGWLVFWAKTAPGVPEDAIGKLCVVRLKDERMLVKKLRRGSKPHLFTLESWNAPAMEDQLVDWASPVIGIRPA